MLWLGSTWNRRHGSTLTSRSDDYRGRCSTNLNPRPTSEQAYGDHLSASLLFYFYNFSHAEKEQKELLPILASFVSTSFVSKTFLQGPCKWLLTCFSLRAALLFPESASHVSQTLGSWNWLFFSKKRQLLSIFAYFCNFNLLFIFSGLQGSSVLLYELSQTLEKYVSCNLPSSSSFLTMEEGFSECRVCRTAQGGTHGVIFSKCELCTLT